MDTTLQALLTWIELLSDDFQALRKSIKMAIAIADSDPEMALVRTRKALETIICEVFSRRAHEAPGTRPLASLVERLTKDGHLPGRIDAYATAIFKLGNVGGHRHEDLTLADVHHAFSQFIPILEWYFTAERPDALRDRTCIPELSQREQAGMLQPPGQRADAVSQLKPRSNLAAPPDLIGRDGILAELREHIRGGGIVVMHGMGGVGKTALALVAANAAFEAGDLPGGAAWVDCELKPNRDECLRKVGEGLFGGRLEKASIDDCRKHIAEHMRTHKALIVLDNFETVARDTELRSWVRQIRPPSCVLITTREELAIQGENPVAVCELSRHDAVQLFLRERKANDQLGGVNALCNAVYGFPLAIILLAKQVISATDLLRELQQSLEVLKVTRGDLPERHRSIEACIALSYESLPAPARDLLSILGVLPGTAGAEVVKAVASTPDWLQAIGDLVAASVCQWDGDRYTIHPLVGRFALDRLGAALEKTELAVARRLAPLIRAKGKQTEAEDYATSLAAFNWFDAEWPNLMAVADYALTANDWPMAAALADNVCEFFLNRGHLHDCADVLQRVLAARQAAKDRPGAALSLFNLGSVCKGLARLADAEAFHRQALQVRRELGLEKDEAASLNGLGDVVRMQGRREEAIELFQEGLAICKRIHDDKGAAQCLHNLGMCYDDDAPLQKLAFDQSVEICRRIQYVRGQAFNLRSLARMFWRQSQFADAIRHYEESLHCFQEIQNRAGEGETLQEMALYWVERGDARRALQHMKEAVEVLQNTEDFPRLGEARLQLTVWSASQLISQRNHREALNCLACRGLETREGMYLAVQCHHSLYELDNALEWANRLMQACPDWLPGRQERGKVLSLLGRFDEAAMELMACRKQDSPDHYLTLEIGFNSWRAGRHEEAVQAFRTARDNGVDVLQTILFESIYLMRTGREDRIPEVVGKTAPRHRTDPDLSTTVLWLGGDISDEELKSYATTPKRKCGIFYWLGEKAMARLDTTQGKVLIAECLATSATTTYEYGHAVAMRNGGEL